jgi:hypothetical protein
MNKIKTAVSGLLLSLAMLFSVSVNAEELKPFFTLKLAGPNALIKTAEKIADLAGQGSTPQFLEVIAALKGMKAVDTNGAIGLALAADENDEFVPVLLLPITDIMEVTVPNYESFFDTVRAFLSKGENGTYLINTPMGEYVGKQQKNYFAVFPQKAAKQILSDPKNLDPQKIFAGLEKYTVALKYDLENIKIETIEKFLTAMQTAAAMQNPNAAANFDQILPMLKMVKEEFRYYWIGLTFDPATANTDVSVVYFPQKGSKTARSFAASKDAATIFSGFKGARENMVGSLNWAHKNTLTVAEIEPSIKQIDIVLAGVLEQIQNDSEEESDVSKFAEKAIDLAKKIMRADMTQESVAGAASFDTNGTFLIATTTAATGEWQELIRTAVDFAAKKASHSDTVADLLQKNSEKTTVAGFKVTSIKIAAADIPHNEGLPKDLAFGFFFAVKENEAIAAAFGFDFSKTEQAFKSALEKTKTAVPVQQPIAEFSVQGLGKFLQQRVYPVIQGIAPSKDLEKFKNVADILTAGNDGSAVTATADLKAERGEFTLRVPGKVIQTLISLVKMMNENNAESQSEIQDF